jgi:hypothetical protein
LQEHHVRRERLDEQAVPPDEFLQVGKFEEFLKLRAEILAVRATTYIRELRSSSAGTSA